MWAALTEMHPILRMYEAFAFRGGWLPRRLPDKVRDRYFAETAAYARLVGGNEEEIPKSAGELAALYRKYDNLFGHSATMSIIPGTGQDFKKLTADVMKRNFHPSQMKAIRMITFQFRLLRLPILGALPRKAQRNEGLGPVMRALAVASRYAALPLIWLLQQPRFERRFMRLMWGPDGVNLIESARKLHKDALEKNKSG